MGKLSDMFKNKFSNKKDFSTDAETIESIRHLAEQGDADAQYKMGQMYEKGIGVSKNESEAQDWYIKAAEQGHSEAHLRSLKIALKSLEE